MKQPKADRQAPSKAVSVFISYAHADEALRKKLGTHMSTVERTGWVREWHDRMILPGQSWADQIDANLEAADLILLLVSPDFVSSNYCYAVEMQRALERHAAGQAVVVPVLLRPTDIKGLPFEKLQGLPTDLTPVTQWTDLDDAFLDIVSGLRRLITVWCKGGVATAGDTASVASESARGAHDPARRRVPAVSGSAEESSVSPRSSAAPQKTWRAKLQQRLAARFRDTGLLPLVRDFVALLRERDPDWPEEPAAVAEYLVNEWCERSLCVCGTVSHRRKAARDR